MLRIISWSIIGIIYNYFNFYFYSKITKVDIKTGRVKLAIILCVTSIINVIFRENFNILFKALSYILLNIVMFRYIFKQNLSKTILMALFLYMTFALCDALFVLVFVMILKFNSDSILNSIGGAFFSNFVILTLVFGVFYIPFLKKIIRHIIEWYEENNILNTIIIVFLSISTIFFFLYQNYISTNSLTYFLIINFLFVSFLIFIIGYFKQKTDNNRLLNMYDQLLDYVKLYENEVVDKSKKQHEYNNQLILLREMIPKKDKNVLKYISEIIKDIEVTNDNTWFDKLKNIPQGGLKGLIYYKINQMIDKNIKVYVEINEQLNSKKIWKILDDNLQDISRLIGIYIDNAIEASSKSDSKFIIIDAECDNNKIIFNFSNTYSNNIDLEKIDNPGYSTNKKIGKGYGLSLASDILSKNNKIEQQREINGIYYVQKLILNLSK